jgi:large subunit ribosomal protein L31e
MKNAKESKETEEATEIKEHKEDAPAEESEVVETPEEIEEIAAEESEEVEELAEEEEIIEEAAEEEAEEEVEEEVVEEEEAEEIKPEIVEEKIYTIPLSRAWVTPRKKRAPRAVGLVRSFVERHMKVGTEAEGEGGEGEAGRLVISNEVNEKIWSRGIEKPPRRIRVRAAKDVEGTVTVYLAEGD